jgi:DNA-directed RNA polymerase subunit beta
MIGGGEFIINGAERVIVNQLHRSPGVDFLVEVQEGDRPLHGCRVIPERGSWIECSVTKKDALAVRIDQSSKIPATTFLRALDKKLGTTEGIIREFYTVESVKVGQLNNHGFCRRVDHRLRVGRRDHQARRADRRGAGEDPGVVAQDVDVVTKVADPLILNTIAEDNSTSHEDALMRIYARLRPGNPPQLEKAKTLFNEKFYDETVTAWAASAGSASTASSTRTCPRP